MKMNGQVERKAFRRMEAELINNDNEPWSTSGQCAGKMTWRIAWSHPSPPPSRVFVVKTGVAIASNNSGILNPGVNGQIFVQPIEDGLAIAAFEKAILKVENGVASATISGSSGVDGPVPAGTSFFARWGSSVVVGHRPVTLPNKYQDSTGFSRRAPLRTGLATALQTNLTHKEPAAVRRPVRDSASRKAESVGATWLTTRLNRTASGWMAAGETQYEDQDSPAMIDFQLPKDKSRIWSPWRVHTDHGHSFCLTLFEGQRSFISIDVLSSKPTQPSGSSAADRRLMAFSLRSGHTWGPLLMGKNVSRMSMMVSAGPVKAGPELWTALSTIGYPKNALQTPVHSANRHNSPEAEGTAMSFAVRPIKLKSQQLASTAIQRQD
jgi:hypothetical protein